MSVVDLTDLVPGPGLPTSMRASVVDLVGGNADNPDDARQGGDGDGDREGEGEGDGEGEGEGEGEG